MPGGRPPHFDSPDDILKIGESYFDACMEREEVPTIAGLAFELGFSDRRSVYDYEGRTEFSHVIKRLRLRIEAVHERLLSGNSVAGHIFWLKNHGWKDTQHQEVDQTSKIISAEPLTAEEWAKRYGNA